MSIFLDAAYQVLKDTNRPMSYEEITQQALNRDLLITRGATPERTMAASLYVDIKEKGATSRFSQISPNQFALNDHQSIKSLPTSIGPKEKHHHQKKEAKIKAVVSKDSWAHKRLAACRRE